MGSFCNLGGAASPNGMGLFLQFGGAASPPGMASFCNLGGAASPNRMDSFLQLGGAASPNRMGSFLQFGGSGLTEQNGLVFAIWGERPHRTELVRFCNLGERPHRTEWVRFAKWAHRDLSTPRRCYTCHNSARRAMAKSKKISIARRNFLKGAAGGAAALAASPQTVKAQQVEPPRYAAARPAPAERDPTPTVEVLTADRPGSDFMTDII